MDVFLVVFQRRFFELSVFLSFSSEDYGIFVVLQRRFFETDVLHPAGEAQQCSNWSLHGGNVVFQRRFW